jgi:hypothetical protein
MRIGPRSDRKPTLSFDAGTAPAPVPGAVNRPARSTR